MNAEQFAVFKHAAVHELMKLNEDCEQRFNCSSLPRWDYDLDPGTLTFSREGVPKVRASIQVAGSSSKITNTWLWAWANATLPEKVTQGARIVRSFGQRENLAQLIQERLPDDEHLGWEMTAIAAKVLGAKGAYRCSGDHGFLYVLYTAIGFVFD